MKQKYTNWITLFHLSDSSVLLSITMASFTSRLATNKFSFTKTSFFESSSSSLDMTDHCRFLHQFQKFSFSFGLVARKLYLHCPHSRPSLSLLHSYSSLLSLLSNIVITFIVIVTLFQFLHRRY